MRASHLASGNASRGCFGFLAGGSSATEPMSAVKVLDLGEHVRPFLQHLGLPVGDADREMVVAAVTELADTVTQLGLCPRERERTYQIGSTHLVLLGTEEHEMPAMVLQIAGICRLILLVALAVLIQQGHQQRR